MTLKDSDHRARAQILGKNQSHDRAGWRTPYGFYLAAIGSSIGIGNLWRFPYVVSSNGGGSFVLLYIFLALLIGLPLLLAELMLGRNTRRSGSVAFRKMGAAEYIKIHGHSLDRPSDFSKLEKYKTDWLWRGFGRLGNMASVLLLSYYAVISGWVLFFLIQFTSGLLTDEPFRANRVFRGLMESGLLQFGLALTHILITGVIVAKGLREGLERWVGWIMPMFGLLMIYLVAESLALPGAEKAIRFLLYPNFSEFKFSSLIYVLGHVFFTLSIGVSAMTTFGSYLQDSVHLPSASFRVTIVDIAVSLFSGMIIFPIVFSGGLQVGADPSLLFRTVPLLFETIRIGKYFGVVFFLCLYLAALGASIGLLESGVASLMDKRHFSRGKSSVLLAILVSGLALFPAFSSTYFSNIQVRGMGLLGIMDAVLINGVIPLVALGISLVIGFKMPEDLRRWQFEDAAEPRTKKLYWQWLVVLRWIAPALILMSLCLSWSKALQFAFA